MAIAAGLVPNNDEDEVERPSKKLKTVASELEAAKARVVALEAQVASLMEQNTAILAHNDALGREKAELMEQNVQLAASQFFQPNSMVPAGFEDVAVAVPVDNNYKLDIEALL